jgi:hypothetical protein
MLSTHAPLGHFFLFLLYFLSRIGEGQFCEQGFTKTPLGDFSEGTKTAKAALRRCTTKDIVYWGVFLPPFEPKIKAN